MEQLSMLAVQECASPPVPAYSPCKLPNLPFGLIFWDRRLPALSNHFTQVSLFPGQEVLPHLECRVKCSRKSVKCPAARQADSWSPH